MKTSKKMKRIISVLILLLVVVSGLVLANRETKDKPTEKSSPKPLTSAEMKAARIKWENTPDGVLFKKWEASEAGKKVFAAEAKIRKSVRDNSLMEGVVTSLSLPEGSRVGFGMMVKINGEDFILSFGVVKPNEFQHLKSLKVNDSIGIKSHSLSHAPKYAYPIVGGDYIERNGKVIYKAPPRKGC